MILRLRYRRCMTCDRFHTAAADRRCGCRNVSLKGGLDSNIISAVAAREFKKQGKTLHTFSVNYEDNEKYFHSTKFQPNSDQHYIEVMQSFLQSDHHNIVLKNRGFG